MKIALVETLNEALAELGLLLNSEAFKKLLNYIELLQKWNKAYNLIGSCTDEELISRHILDSLSVAKYIKGQNILDVGTGAGLPGIPLAIALTDKKFTLIDSNSKKTRFLEQVCFNLGLPNVRIINTRIENFENNVFFDVIITRAFSSLSTIIQKTQHLLAKNGLYYAMKGKWPKEELAALEEEFKIQIYKLEVPGLNAQRHLVILEEN